MIMARKIPRNGKREDEEVLEDGFEGSDPNEESDRTD